MGELRRDRYRSDGEHGGDGFRRVPATMINPEASNISLQPEKIRYAIPGNGEYVFDRSSLAVHHTICSMT